MSRQHAPDPVAKPASEVAKRRKARRDKQEGPRVEDYPVGRVLRLLHRAANGYEEYMTGRVVSRYLDRRFALGWGTDVAVFVVIETVADQRNAHLLDQVVPLSLGQLYFRRGLEVVA